MLSQPSFSPYVGPQPFRRSDATRFFGREEPTEELFSLVLASRVVVLYAQSGTGKSSLVNAGLRPLLEEDGFDILPSARVQGGLPAGTSALDVRNPYAYFTLASWGEQAADPSAEGVLSAALARRPRPTDRYRDPAYRLLVFDQFEELFTFYPECWAQRERFVAELARCVADDERLRILFVAREDYLADVLGLVEAFPPALRSSFRLPLLGKVEAAESIEGPLRGSGFTYADGVVSQLVEDLTEVRVETSPGKVVEVPGDSVETVQLQVVCTELWRALPPGTTVITSEHVRSLGDADAALAHYYDNAVKDAAKQTKIDPVFVRRWISAELVTPAKTRGTAYRGVRLTAGLPNPAVDALENRHVIRAETRSGARWYELTHDRFLRPIEKANARAIRRGRLAYWPAALPFAALVSGMSFQHQWPHGHRDVLLRLALALVAAIGMALVFSVVARRRLQYWKPCERRAKGTRMAALARRTVIVATAALVWLSFLFGSGEFLFSTVDTPSCDGGSTIGILYRHGGGIASACLHESSTYANWGLAFAAILLAVALSSMCSRCARRLAVRRWRRMGRRTRRDEAGDDPGEPPARVASHAPYAHAAATTGQDGGDG